MTTDEPATEPENQDSVFGTGYKLFLGLAGALFAIIAVAIPMVIIAANLTDGGGSTAAPGTTVPALPGEDIAVGAGCLGCHMIDGSDWTGPTWLGLAGTEREFESGDSAIADDAYLTESIVDPAARIVAGYQNVMPQTYSDTLTQDEIADIVEYINSLG